MYASVLCLLFMVSEIVGGILSNSLAIATDAAHLLADFGSFMISLFAIWVAARPKSQKFSFGLHRAEVLGALLSVLMIWLITGVLVYMAVLRILHNEHKVDAPVMLITSSIGVAFNIIMGCTLGHGHSHGGSDDKEKQGPSSSGHTHENINVKAAFIHVVGDLMQSIGVYIASLIIYFYPEYTIVDPICTFIFSVLVLATTISILKQTVGILMEATPPGINYEFVKNTCLSVEGVIQVQNLRIWSLTSNKTALMAHLFVEAGVDTQKVLKEANKKICASYTFYELTLQVEDIKCERTFLEFRSL